jgi:hypothetical protein
MLVVRGRLWAQLRVERVPELESIPAGTGPEEDGVLVERPVELAGRVEFAIAELAARLERPLDRARSARTLVRDHETIDESSILNRFLFRNAGHPALVPIPLTDDGILAPDLDALARRALSISDDELATLDARKAGDADPDDRPAKDPGIDAVETEAGSVSEAL